jgi:2-dehydro-3-deoxygluconokinase
MTVAVIGECMIELRRRGDGAFDLSYSGDTANFAIYLARLGTPSAYVTAVGDDRYSDGMAAMLGEEGVETGLVLRVPGRVPGLYTIEVDETGERSFTYWRGEAPVRELLDLPQAADLGDRLAAMDWVYLTGITLAILGEGGRARMHRLLDEVRGRGVRVAFDGNYRASLWPSEQAARDALAAVLPRVDLALPTFDDERALFGDADPEAAAERLRDAGVPEVAVKLGRDGALVAGADGTVRVPLEASVQPVDTTAAGDSFNAGYLAGRLAGLAPEAAVRRGQRLAGVVVQHPGAIIPRAAMPDAAAGG